jgi:predicted ArsR family transcriptional regulator
VSTRDRARAHGALSAPARLEVLDHLRACAEPVDAHAVAAATGLHVTTVRFHLDALIEAGLVVSHRRPPSGRGRPRTLYAPSFGPGDPYRELSEVLAAHFGDTAERRTRRARRAGHEWAAQRLSATPAPSRSPAEARRVVAGLFTEMGFDPEFDPEPAHGDRVLLHGCPFRDTARDHPEVVCAAHQGLLAGLLARLDPAAPVPVLEPFVRPQLCAIDFAGAGGGPEAR